MPELNRETLGTTTALITPFKEAKGHPPIDFDALSMLVEEQMQAGNAILLAGTTGESPALSQREHGEISRFVLRQVQEQVPVIEGTGTNATQESIDLTRQAARNGVNGVLLVNPYYNKPTQEGMRQHFGAIAESEPEMPMILYNIRGRTIVNLETDTLLRISDDHPNVIGVKEASGDLSQMVDVIRRTREGFLVLSGDDNMTYALMSHGGDGVISVLSNIAPEQTHAMVAALQRGDYEEARRLYNELLPLMKGCFMETNPIPVKTAQAMRGKCGEVFRLPMTQMSPPNRARWQTTLHETGILPAQ